MTCSKTGLPWFDIMFMKQLPKAAALPVATVQETKRRIQGKRWDINFQYIFFTESDQVVSLFSILLFIKTKQ